jgi:hypothetical protein
MLPFGPHLDVSKCMKMMVFAIWPFLDLMTCVVVIMPNAVIFLSSTLSQVGAVCSKIRQAIRSVCFWLVLLWTVYKLYDIWVDIPM